MPILILILHSVLASYYSNSNNKSIFTFIFLTLGWYILSNLLPQLSDKNQRNSCLNFFISGPTRSAANRSRAGKQRRR